MTGRELDAPRYAYYFPGRAPRQAWVIKNLLLFFDALAVLSPDPLARSPSWISELRRLDRLRIFEPFELYGPCETEAMADFLGRIADRDFTDLCVPPDAEPIDDDRAPYRRLDHGRLGLQAADNKSDLPHTVNDLLRQGLLREHGPQEYIASAALVSAVLTQATLITAAGARAHRAGRESVDLQPITDKAGGLQHNWWHLVDDDHTQRSYAEEAAETVSRDFSHVGVGESINERSFEFIIEYRDRHRDAYNRYTESLFNHIQALQGVTFAERETLLAHRKDELQAAKQQFDASQRHSFGACGGFFVDIAYAALSVLGELPNPGNAGKAVIDLAKIVKKGPSARLAAKSSPYAYVYGFTR